MTTREIDSGPPAATLTGAEAWAGIQAGVDVTLTAALVAALPRAISTVTGLTAALAAKVGNSGNEAVDGIKTFSSAPMVPNGSFALAKVAGLSAALLRLCGADVGAPGGTDDTLLVTTARAAAGVGGTLAFGPGTYVVTGLAASVADQHWIIQPGATIKTKNGANAPTIDVTANGVTIDGGGTIDGNRTNQTSTTIGHAGTGDTACVRVISRSNVTVRGVWLKNGGTQAVFADACTSLTITENRISGCCPTGNVKAITVFDAVALSVDLRITDNTIDATAQASGCIGVTVFNARSVKQLRITGNRLLLGNAGATATLGIELFTTVSGLISDASVSNNVISGPSGVIASDQVFGISVGGSTTSTTAGDNTVAVTGNTIRNCPVMSIEVIGRGVSVAGNTIIGSGPIAVTAVEVPDGIHGVTVSGNSLTDSTDVNYAISLDGGTYGIYGLVVVGNVIRNAAGLGIVTAGVINGATITANTITDCNGGAVVLQGTLTDSLIGSNVLDLTGVGGSTSDGILVASTTIARLGINDNTIKGASRHGIYGLSACSDVSIVGNRITHCTGSGLFGNAAMTRWSVYSNTISHNTDRGLIFYVASTDLAIASNSIHNNPGGAYYTTGSTFLTHIINGAGG